MSLTILEGSTFCICDEIGNLGGTVNGLFAEDTRFLSELELRINGERPLLLSCGKVEYFSAAFFLRNPLAGGLPQDVLSITRERFVGEGMQDHVCIRNESPTATQFVLELDVATDFADIISVKERDFDLGHPDHAPPLPPPAAVRFDADRNQLVLEENGHGSARTQVILSRPGEIGGGTVRFPVELGPRKRWELRIDVVASLDGRETAPRTVARRFGAEREHVRDSLTAWRLRTPRLESSCEPLRQTFAQSLADLAALRMRTHDSVEMLPAAGMPWFMTVFGRDTIITSLQSMLLGPELALASLDALAKLQAHEVDPSIDAEPGKILHELRRGRAAETWFATYYGSVDATPLFLVLLSEVWRWTGDPEPVARLREPALAALAWIDRYGDRDGDGFVEYERQTPRGLENQSWKDSGDSQRFRDGTFARTPIAPVEVQGYVYDAKLRVAELAREVWHDVELADRLEREAAELAQRFDEAFWVEERGGFYALALDADKRPVDSLCSNLGHLLWSGIVPAERRGNLTNRLLGSKLWSGWGLRTMSTADAAFNPIGYHTGTVWPHDTSLGAWGLARTGNWSGVAQITEAVLSAAGHFDWSLPEVFAGFSRSSTPFPIAYPTAASPQAWAAGAPVLLLRLLLGLEPDAAEDALRSVCSDPLPEWLGSLRLSGVRARGRSWDVIVENGKIAVSEA
ncbi:MAG TPA: glycogen debranching N-terminal domain-containing protein [Gaiellaceae bacterium]|nr:glycogen debranching N-terminal domain-containing protein [Gaiellaceae bacterium]